MLVTTIYDEIGARPIMEQKNPIGWVDKEFKQVAKKWHRSSIKAFEYKLFKNNPCHQSKCSSTSYFKNGTKHLGINCSKNDVGYESKCLSENYF